jgi:hypothetical protein
MSLNLPVRASCEYLKKLAKERLGGFLCCSRAIAAPPTQKIWMHSVFHAG